jgi:hypothetical protein
MGPVTREDWNEMEALGYFKGVLGAFLYEFSLDQLIGFPIGRMILSPCVIFQSPTPS